MFYMQNIIINGRFLSQAVTGVQRYALGVVKALDDLLDSGVIDPGLYSFTLLAPKDIRYRPDLRHIDIEVVGRLKGHLWEQVELPLYADKRVLVNLCTPAPLIKRNQVVMIHDAATYACPDEFSTAFRTWYKIMLYGLCKRAAKVVTVSNFSKKELAHYCKTDETNIHVVYPGIDHFNQTQADESVLQKYDLSGKKFVLAVSSLSPRKNFLRLVDAIATLGDTDLDLVVVGGSNHKVFNRIGLESRNRVKWLSSINDKELKALYGSAYCFAFPSWYEGFGLPPIEAMLCGCPVVAANRASLPEVCGEAALYCDPYDPQDIAGKIRLLWNNASLRDDLQARGLARASVFTWEKCAQDMWFIIRQLLS